MQSFTIKDWGFSITCWSWWRLELFLLLAGLGDWSFSIARQSWWLELFYPSLVMTGVSGLSAPSPWCWSAVHPTMVLEGLFFVALQQLHGYPPLGFVVWLLTGTFASPSRLSSDWGLSPPLQWKESYNSIPAANLSTVFHYPLLSNTVVSLCWSQSAPCSFLLLVDNTSYSLEQITLDSTSYIGVLIKVTWMYVPAWCSGLMSAHGSDKLSKSGCAARE
jgi:hypothetical protein